MEALKYSEVYMIACQNPDFFMVNGIRPYESGFDIEKRLFPNLKKVVYAQDYMLLENLNSETAKQFGKRPKSANEAENYV